jgi:predicted amidohydrolase
MTRALKVSCIQHCVGVETDQNLKTLESMIDESVADGADLVCLPEYTTCYGSSRGKLVVGAAEEESHIGLQTICEIASRKVRWILIGSIAIKRDDGLINNRSYLINDAGDIVARYDKVHLFDVDLDGGESYRESDSIKAGDKAVLVDTPFGRLGLSICYDIRFPQLYRTLAKAGAEILFIPAAFTRTTGQAHWHTLVQARAIESGAYVVAPCQCGDANGELKRYGHSLIVDPWGKVLADGGEEPGIASADIDLDMVSAARQKIPALTHDRLVEISIMPAKNGEEHPTSHPNAS